MSQPDFADGKTGQRRIEQFRDRWSTGTGDSGLLSISEKPSPETLRQYELFAPYEDAFLEKISPDVAIANWQEGAILFEEGAYIDLAFFVASGEVEVFVDRERPEGGGAQPIFDLGRTAFDLPAPGSSSRAPAQSQPASRSTLALPSGDPRREIPSGVPEITFLGTMDFDLPRSMATRLGKGELFGEIGALSGWPQSATVRTASACELVQIRLPALRAMKRKSKALKERLDVLYRERSLLQQLQMSPILGQCNPMFLNALKHVVQLVSLDPGEVLVREGDAAGSLYLVRSGFLKLQQGFAEGEIVVTYLSKGMTFGEVELLVEGLDSWQATATSVEYAELVQIPRETFEYLVRLYPDVEELLWRTAADRIKEAGFSRRHADHSQFLEVALGSGLVQGNSILAIDLDTCTRCDDCVRACADTHDGRPRFVREGEKYQNVLLARSCYHCRDPVCLIGCPTGAIHRAGVGDVVAIDERICIGCSTCANNCPYDAIVMHDTGEVWPDDMLPAGLRGLDKKVASKCDLCFDTGHGPACVSNCPQGCAYRVGSIEEFEELIGTKS